MAYYKDLSPNEQSWIHDLAKAEIHPDAERILDLGRSFSPQQLVEENTVEFLTSLRERFEEFARIFNSYSGKEKGFPEVKVYGMAQSAADFMLFRNQVKLIVSTGSHGVIQFSFAKHARENLAVDGALTDKSSSNNQPNEVIAQVGPFRNVYWTYRGERVSPREVAKFYFAEFIRASRSVKSSKTGNQMLLDQIKSLLQEKGMDL